MSYKLKENFIYNIAYQVVALLVPLITMPYISRVLGAQGIGYYSYTFSVVSLAISFAVLGGDAHGNRSIARVNENRYERSKVFWNIFAVQVISTIIASSIYLLYAVFSGEYKCYLLLQGIHLIASLLNINWYFYGRGQFKIMVIRNIIIKLLTLVSIFIFVRTPYDTEKYIVILGVCDLLSVIVVWPHIFKNIQYVKLKISDISKQIKPMLLLFIPVISMSLYKKMDRVMLGTLSTIIENGYYENVDKIIAVPSSIISALGLVMLPQISNMLATRNRGESITLINKMMRGVTLLSCAMCFGISAISRDFVPLFFGEEFIPCIELMIMMSPVIIFQGYSNMIRSAYLIPCQLDKIYIRSTVAGAIVNFIVNILLIRKYGAMGATIGTVIAEFTVVTIQMWYIRFELPVKKYIIEVVPFAIIGSIMFIVINIVKNLFHASSIIIVTIEVLTGIAVFAILGLLYIKLRERYDLLKASEVSNI